MNESKRESKYLEISTRKFIFFKDLTSPILFFKLLESKYLLQRGTKYTKLYLLYYFNSLTIFTLYIFIKKKKVFGRILGPNGKDM